MSCRAAAARFDESDFLRFPLKSFTGLSVKPYEDVVRPAPMCDNVFICSQMFMNDAYRQTYGERFLRIAKIPTRGRART